MLGRRGNWSRMISLPVMKVHSTSHLPQRLFLWREVQTGSYLQRRKAGPAAYEKFGQGWKGSSSTKPRFLKKVTIYALLHNGSGNSPGHFCPTAYTEVVWRRAQELPLALGAKQNQDACTCLCFTFIVWWVKDSISHCSKRLWELIADLGRSHRLGALVDYGWESSL